MSVQSELVVLTFANKFLGPLFLCTKSFDNKVLKLSKKNQSILKKFGLKTMCLRKITYRGKAYLAESFLP